MRVLWICMGSYDFFAFESRKASSRPEWRDPSRWFRLLPPYGFSSPFCSVVTASSPVFQPQLLVFGLLFIIYLTVQGQRPVSDSVDDRQPHVWKPDREIYTLVMFQLCVHFQGSNIHSQRNSLNTLVSHRHVHLPLCRCSCPYHFPCTC